MRLNVLSGKIFKEFCAACHAEQPVIDVHAPHIHDKKVWDSLGKLGMPILLKITTQGIGAMPVLLQYYY